MKRPVPKQYKPAEMTAALDALAAAGLREITARLVLMALYNRGYKIVYTGEPTK